VEHGKKGVKIITKNDMENKLTEKEKKLLELIRSTEYGEFRIIIHDEQPVKVEEIKKDIKL